MTHQRKHSQLPQSDLRILRGLSGVFADGDWLNSDVFTSSLSATAKHRWQVNLIKWVLLDGVTVRTMSR